MRIRRRTPKRLLVSLTAVAALFAVSASSASADWTWSEEFPLRVKGELTYDRDTYAPVTCELDTLRYGHYYGMTGDCDGGTELSITSLLNPFGMPVLVSPQYPTPWGGSLAWYMSGTSGEWVEGDAETPSRIVFDDVYTGYAGEESYFENEVRLDGYLEITTPDGGFVTWEAK